MVDVPTYIKKLIDETNVGYQNRRDPSDKLAQEKYLWITSVRFRCGWVCTAFSCRMCLTGRRTNKPWESYLLVAEVRTVGISWGCLQTLPSSLSTATPTLPTADPTISGLSKAGGPWALWVEAVSSSKFQRKLSFFTFHPQFCPRGCSWTWSCPRPACHPKQKCNQQLLKGLPWYHVGLVLPHWFW